jgi:LemA protein
MDGIPSLLGANGLVIIGVIVLIALLAIGAYVIGVYNSLRRLQVRANNGFSQIDVQLKRRFDLIPNLVEMVKGYMAHERGTLEAVIAARAQAASALGAVNGAAVGGVLGVSAITQLANASGALDGALHRLIGLVEAYPELKANENALRLQEELASTENRIAFARQAYNDAVMRLNESIVVFPASVIANTFGIRTMGLFQADANERATVAVKF